MARFREQLTRLHPAWSLVLILVSVCTAVFAITIEAFNLHMATTFVICLLSLMWAHGIYDRTASEASTAGRARWGPWLFVATEIALAGVAVFMLIFFESAVLQAGTGGLPALVVIPYFVCLWLSAAALARAEGRGHAASGATLGTFLLIVYWVIGAWFIQPRLARLDASATAA